MNEQKTNWHLPTKIKGEAKVAVTYRIDPLFTQALKEFAAEQSKLQGIKISAATVIITSVLKYNKVVAQRYKQLKRENKDESNQKHWDVKKSGSII